MLIQSFKKLRSLIRNPSLLRTRYKERIRTFKYNYVRKTVLSDERLAKVGTLNTIDKIINSAAGRDHSVATMYCEIANFLVNTGQPELAQTYYMHSLKAKRSAYVYSLYLQCLLLSPSCTDEFMYKMAIRYNKLFLGSVKKYKTYPNKFDVNKKLNVGYICHFFHNSVSESLLLPFLRNHDRNRISVVCYSDTEPHEINESIKNCSELWRDTKNLTDEQLAELIRKDKIDILLELNGHCVVNRYNVIARKPAPIQISFYNHCATTGISTIDYVLLGDEITLDKSKSYYSESMYFLKGVSGVANFPDSFPDCSPPPCLKNGYITFGSFGAAHKVNAELIKLWCKVLKRVPNSKFYMKASVLTHQDYLDAYKKLFNDEGIPDSRLQLEGYSEHRVMLERYSNMDIGLDTFPYAAGTTTMEATWQGIPIITLCGSNFCGQNGKGILNSIGHPELIAYSQDEFITKAAELASAPERLVNYRQCLRNDFRKSPRTDGKAYANKLEDAYFDMWKRLCIQKNAALS